TAGFALLASPGRTPVVIGIIEVQGLASTRGRGASMTVHAIVRQKPSALWPKVGIAGPAIGMPGMALWRKMANSSWASSPACQSLASAVTVMPAAVGGWISGALLCPPPAFLRKEPQGVEDARAVGDRLAKMQIGMRAPWRKDNAGPLRSGASSRSWT